MEVIFVFKHPNEKIFHPKGQIIKSVSYTIDEILETDVYEIQDNICKCDCQPIGETNVVECNCYDYYEEFELVGKEYIITLFWGFLKIKLKS